ncbi:hypothetical protein [Hymenobacter terricola]|uniref:hypothetical protein n=1 Tax=Hymenobacter terricola TaxID=2819236 RepID=UPI001B3060BB|nr:hypothetical protein [Hymenobacter terricola]
MSAPNPRAPHLSEAQLRQALDGLDAKIKTLHNRAHATAAGSANTYQQHAEALEAKRAQLAEQLNQAPAPPEGPEPGVWKQIRHGIDSLDDDVQALL